MRAFLLLLLLTACAPPPARVTTFDHSPAGWMAYDYDGGVAGGGNVFVPARWTPGYIWANDTMWRIDTPEEPDSVLALLVYQDWSGGAPLDLRGATVTLRLRSDGLDLRGGRATFWVHSTRYGTRYHLLAPLDVPAGRWGETTLWLDGAWHRSWSYRDAATVGEVLSSADSYGIAFVGFQGEPTGRLSVDEVRIVW